ncbi:MAG: hypothetical protein FWF63_00050 [Fibromonadales bacterium]|nr:hypothetical protein [Fibromonadales bacterium]
MQRKLKSLLVVTSCAIAASLVILACGEGIPVEIASYQQTVDTSMGVVIDKIKDKGDTSIWSGYVPPPPPPPPPVSSSEDAPPIPQSSSDETPILPSSSSGGGLPPIPQSSSSAPVAQSSSSALPKSSSSQAAAAGGCKESNPKGGFTCGWDGYTSGSVLVPGKVLKPTNATLPSGCTEVAWKFAPDTTQMAQVNACKALPAEGLTAEGSRNYILFGELTCDDGKHTTACNPKTGWSSKRAPEITGTCKWDRSPAETTTGRGAKPSGVTVVDPDKVCSSPTVDYIYAGTKKWNLSTGILDEWKSWDKKHKETYSDVTPTLNCPAYGATVALPACPDLKVSAGADYTIELDCGSSSNGGFDQCKGKNEAVLKPDECVDMYVLNYSGDPRPVVVECNVDGNNGSASVTVKGSPKTISGYYGALDLANLKSGENEFGTLCLTSSGSLTIKCKLAKR